MNKLNFIVWTVAGILILILRQPTSWGLGAAVCFLVAALLVRIDKLEKK